jgi:hypothetical protein
MEAKGFKDWLGESSSELDEVDQAWDDPAALWVLAKTTNSWRVIEKILEAPALEGDTIHWIWVELLGMKPDRDRTGYVVANIAVHPNTAPETLLSISKGAPYWLLEKLKRNPNWPEDVADWVLGDW